MSWRTWADPTYPLPMRERGRRAGDDALLKLAYLLPRRLVMWCAVRVILHGTTGKHENQVVPELTAMDALDRWGCG